MAFSRAFSSAVFGSAAVKKSAWPSGAHWMLETAVAWFVNCRASPPSFPSSQICVTASSSPRLARNAIVRPSGDHRGEDSPSMPFVSCSVAEPSASTRQTCVTRLFAFQLASESV